MNSVHEPDSRTMSKNLTQEKYRVKSGQKQAECAGRLRRPVFKGPYDAKPLDRSVLFYMIDIGLI